MKKNNIFFENYVFKDTKSRWNLAVIVNSFFLHEVFKIEITSSLFFAILSLRSTEIEKFFTFLFIN